MIKQYPHSFRATELLVFFEKCADYGVSNLWKVPHMHIDTTVRAVCDYGFKSVVIRDPCATKDLELDGGK
jgi:hypothetical protein